MAKKTTTPKKTTKRAAAKKATATKSATKKTAAGKTVRVCGARVHNLKNITVEIPRDKMTVITGLSGSGKSSLAFDVIYAESNRRFMESISSYARSVIGVTTKPDVDAIEGLSPAIAIDQKSVSRSPRSTVGTMTEIYDYLRILFATVGVPYCPETGKVLRRKTTREIVEEIMGARRDANIMIMAPVDTKERATSDALKKISQEGYARVRMNGKVMSTRDAVATVSDSVHIALDVVVDALTFDPDYPDRERLADSVETATRVGEGSCTLVIDTEEKTYSRDYYCKESGFRIPELTPRHFSFNTPQGACPECDGLGERREIDPEMLIPNKDLSISEGAIRVWQKTGTKSAGGGVREDLEDLARRFKFDLTTPVKKLSKAHLALVLYGAPSDTSVSEGEQKGFVGIVPELERRYRDSKSEYMRSEIEKCMTTRICPSCDGKRLSRPYLSVKVAEHSIDYYVKQSLPQFIESLDEVESFAKIDTPFYETVSQLVREMRLRAQALCDVGVDYLTLARSSETISGGEAQRIRLAVQVRADLTGVFYILDEPTTGLHSRDTKKLLTTMRKLEDVGNTLIVVEHDAVVMQQAEWIVDMGPGAGEEGGEVVFSGSQAALKRAKTPTAQYLSGKKNVSSKKTYRKGSGKKITIANAVENNLQGVTVDFPLGTFTAVCGVSGSGKSTLVHNILSRYLAKHFYRAHKEPGACDRITGVGNIDKVITIDQSPIGRTPRSNAATYTGVFAHIRDVFAATDTAQERGYTASRFSFNMRGGRCEVCQGDGQQRVEMQLLNDMYVACESCSGTRYNAKTLEVLYNGVSIAEVLDMSISYALEFFKKHDAITKHLEVMDDVGLGYLRLGQSATELSGGEAQRIKLATELARKGTGKTLYILDEPTTGLHFEDTVRLLGVLDALVDRGNTVIVVEHNTDVVRHADWVIELGPDGGVGGGQIVYEGTPNKLKKHKKSPTAAFL